MHKSHLLGCAIGITAAIVLLGLSGGSVGAVGVLVAALACPLVMLLMMKTMMADTPRRSVGSTDAADSSGSAVGRPSDG